jgi:hypothetical protein
MCEAIRRTPPAFLDHRTSLATGVVSMPIGGAPAATDLADGMGFIDDTTIHAVARPTMFVRGVTGVPAAV